MHLREIYFILALTIHVGPSDWTYCRSRRARRGARRAFPFSHGSVLWPRLGRRRARRDARRGGRCRSNARSFAAVTGDPCAWRGRAQCSRKADGCSRSRHISQSVPAQAIARLFDRAFPRIDGTRSPAPTGLGLWGPIRGTVCIAERSPIAAVLGIWWPLWGTVCITESLGIWWASTHAYRTFFYVCALIRRQTAPLVRACHTSAGAPAIHVVDGSAPGRDVPCPGLQQPV